MSLAYSHLRGMADAGYCVSSGFGARAEAAVGTPSRFFYFQHLWYVSCVNVLVLHLVQFAEHVWVFFAKYDFSSVHRVLFPPGLIFWR